MDTNFLQETMIFKKMTKEEITAALTTLQAEEKNYKKGDFIFTAGDTTDKMGLVMEGSVTIEINDVWGNRTLLNHIGKKQFFAETYALLENETMLVDVCANENCRILFFRTGNLYKDTKNTSNIWYVKLISNLLTISMHKNLHLSGHSFHTASKTVRGRIMSYLNSISLQQHRKEFDIPFDRQQLADYLNIDRTALSKELGKMQREEIISFKKNHFVIL